MKALITLILISNTYLVFAQDVNFNIQGRIEDTKNAKYAYLSTLSQRIPISSDKIFMITPIVDGKFGFQGVFDLQGRTYQQACVFVDERGNISKEELLSKFRKLVWVIGREENLREIILEDLTLDIDEPAKIIYSKVVERGTLTKQLDEYNENSRSGRKMLDFVKKYPDSPFTFEVIRSLTSVIVPANRDRIESKTGSLSGLYALLSERLKNSKEGISLKQQIDKKSKP
ncbi:hypothetical protein ABIE26_002532 [Pedobacter africanus]|uniref:Uncharacterized protein n=1 Tax=Pedobacter africanus TaxID=151894 RepID=A0ACC6KY88_9SPHI|nr:hypothetical protein [Pedobacter africanus]MDR6784079.1 hypothetical protein [Pedobacter africanus]